MESFIKIEKAMALMTHRRNRRLKRCFLLLAASWLLVKLPATALQSNLFVFLLCNAVILLVAFLSNADADGDIDSPPPPPDGAMGHETEEIEKVVAEAEKKVKAYRRTQSDTCGTLVVEKKKKKLMRSQTERERRMEDLSNEEFRLRIEAFITTHKCKTDNNCTTLMALLN